MVFRVYWIDEHSELVEWLGGLSVATFIISLLAVPYIISRLPEDYFVRGHHRDHFKDRHPVLRWAFLIGKNVLGAVLILGGIAMLVLPGQGILTIVLGLSMVNFPRKREVECWILHRSAVERVVNWIRRKGGHKPLQFPSKSNENAGD